MYLFLHMDSAQDQEEGQVSSLMEETGDSEADLEVKAYDDDYDDDDGRESCNGSYVKCVIDWDRDEEEEGEEEEEEEDDVMTWATWIAMSRSEWGKRGEEERSPSVVDEEENRLFWETCLASGYP